jgi:dihydroneopterin aldolase
MSDRILLHGMAFEGAHGVSDEERADPQIIEMDVEVSLDLSAAGKSDELAQTVNYADVFEVCRVHVEERSYRLLEAIGEAVATDLLARFAAVESASVTVRKPGVPIDGVLEYAGVRIERERRA